MSLPRTRGFALALGCSALLVSVANAQVPSAIVAGRYVAPDGTLKPSVAILLADGKITAVKAAEQVGRDNGVVHYPDAVVAPGLIEVLRRYDVRRILERPIEYDSPSYQEWRIAVEMEGSEVVLAQAGQTIVMDDGVFIQVLNPSVRLLRGTESDVDNASVALRLVYGEISFLLTGDMFSEAERALLARNVLLDSDVLKVAHHGSRSSSTDAFIERVSPAIVVISTGEDNRFGHPHAETVETLRRHVSDELLFLTSDSGTVEFITDGKRLEVRTGR